MTSIPPRLGNLLSILAAERGPLPVQALADRLRVSRRTVFRELAGIGGVLGRYHLELGSRTGEGVLLEGTQQARSALRADLEKLDRSDPADRRNRQDRLLLSLLQTPGQKLAAYAKRLKVSAPTVSRDLDELEPWLAGRGLALRRGQGEIAVTGGEMPVRRVLLTLMHRMEEAPPYPHPDILLDILDLGAELDAVLDGMTPQSRDAIRKYMAVATQRVLDGRVLPAPVSEASSAPGAGAFRDAARRLATALEETFNIRFPAGEIAALEIELAGCRPSIPGDFRDDGAAALALIAGDMAARFDPERAPALRMDEVLMEGLVNHLRTATVRLRHGIELVDPMREQIAKRYPDVLLRSRRACEALRAFGGRLPEDEVTLVAAHFGAALLRLAEADGRRVARVGVICVHGIGSSYLLASQVKRAFGAKALVEVGWLGDGETWRRHDVLVSTVEIPGASVPVAVVPPILGDDDIRRVGELLDSLERVPEECGAEGGFFAGGFKAMEELAGCARALLERFSLSDVPRGVFLAALPRLAGARFGGAPEAAEAIAAALAAREAISTQVIPELRIVLLHCKTPVVDSPLFGVLRPEGGGAFTDPALRGALTCVVMLLPSSASREVSDMMGRVSAALIEQERFLDAVRSGPSERVRDGLERILGDVLLQFALHTLKG